MKTKSLIFLMTALVACNLTLADDNSVYIDVDTNRFSARDIDVKSSQYGPGGAHGGFSFNNGLLHYWSPDEGYATTDVETGAKTVIGLPQSGVQSNGMGDAFGCYDPTTNKFYAAAIDNMSDAHIYEYDATNNTWTNSSAINAYGADTYNGQLYFSGLNETWNGSTGQDNFINRYVSNTPHTYGSTGLGLHDSIIKTVGNSASMAIDNQGNFYYATYYFGSSALFRWDATQVSSVIDDIVNFEEDEFLTLDDATMLTQLDGGGNGITVDDAGNVFITTNGGSESQVVMWNETFGIGEGFNFDVIATLDPSQYWGWFGELDIDGNFLAGDSLYGAFGWQNTITEITYVPEPITIAMLGLGCLMVRRRQK